MNHTLHAINELLKSKGILSEIFDRHQVILINLQPTAYVSVANNKLKLKYLFGPIYYYDLTETVSLDRLISTILNKMY